MVGVILNDIGLEKAMYDLMEHYIKPLSSFLFPLQGQTIDRHHSFVVCSLSVSSSSLS